MTDHAPLPFDAFRATTAHATVQPDQGPKPIVLLFADDSTLIFARRMREILKTHSPSLEVWMGWLSDENALSYRQMTQLLPEGPDLVVRNSKIVDLVTSPYVQAIITSRVFRPLGDEMKKKLVKLQAGRPCVIAFLGGLDFFPKTGFERRRHCDGVYLFPRSDIPRFENIRASYDVAWQEIGFGHPSFVMPDRPKPDLDTRRDIYFFTQALSPSTRRGRLHMLRVMAAMARAYPDRTVWIKLRHLPHENQAHLHRERYDYPGLMATLPDLPDNLKVTADGMDTVLARAAFGVTCTSTAAIDLVRAGVPCMVHLDFVDAYRDQLVAPMRRLFAKSNLITGLDDMLHLRARAPDPDWLADMFCTPDLASDVLQTIAQFQDRPFQIR
ncbi:MAG: DUF6716 putative glycosyltransferase [Pseudomonadota bacterium]